MKIIIIAAALIVYIALLKFNQKSKYTIGGVCKKECKNCEDSEWCIFRYNQEVLLK